MTPDERAAHRRRDAAPASAASTRSKRTRKYARDEQPAQDLAVLRPRQHHQHDLRPHLRSIQAHGSEPRDRHGLHDVDACASAWRCASIQYGDADMMVAGGAEMATTPLRPRQLLPGAGAVHAQRRSAARRAARGIAIATASCCPTAPAPSMLEEYEHAKARGAQHLRGARRLRHERRCASHHRAAGRRRGRAPRDGQCLKDAQLNPSEVQYINAHATSTAARRPRRDASR